MDTDDDSSERGSWTDSFKTPAGIARILGLILFAILFWIEAPPTFLQHDWASFLFATVLWVGELLAYAIGIAGILVILTYAGSHVYYWLRGVRRWFQLQEIKSWRAKRACNARPPLQNE